jgi:hypothetical protein
MEGVILQSNAVSGALVLEQALSDFLRWLERVGHGIHVRLAVGLTDMLAVKVENVFAARAGSLTLAEARRLRRREVAPVILAGRSSCAIVGSALSVSAAL